MLPKPISRLLANRLATYAKLLHAHCISYNCGIEGGAYAGCRADTADSFCANVKRQPRKILLTCPLAAQEVTDCAKATPFRMAAYQAALACGTRYELCEHHSAKDARIAVE